MVNIYNTFKINSPQFRTSNLLQQQDTLNASIFRVAFGITSWKETAQPFFHSQASTAEIGLCAQDKQQLGPIVKPLKILTTLLFTNLFPFVLLLLDALITLGLQWLHRCRTSRSRAAYQIFIIQNSKERAVTQVLAGEPWRTNISILLEFQLLFQSPQ